MNAASISRPDIISENDVDSDSDASSDGIPDYYQPISSSDGDGDVDETEPTINGYHPAVEHLSIGHDYPTSAVAVQNGDSESPPEEEEDEMRRRAEADAAIRRAFLEDESRRNAPLPSQNTARVIEAMRGVSLSGFAPDWANDLVEDRWLDQLQRLRQPPSSAA